MPLKTALRFNAWSWIVWGVVFLLALLTGQAVVHGFTIPPAPESYVSDQAEMLSPGTRAELVAKLEQFERETSNQIVVATMKELPSDAEMNDFCTRTAQAWQVGQKGRKNGLVLFVFQKDRKVYIPQGYGLEGVLPDATIKSIIDEVITPRFKTGDFNGGVRAGVEKIMEATKEEYQGTGKAQGDGKGHIGLIVIVGFIILMVVMSNLSRGSYGSGGSGGMISSLPWLILSGSRGRRGSWGGGGTWGGGGNWGGSSGGGGFRGGGGSFGGGGAGGSW